MPTPHSQPVDRHKLNGAHHRVKRPWLTVAAVATLTAAAAQLWKHRRRVFERRDWVARRQLHMRITGEFAEMPGMTLTFAQACRLLGLGRGVCERVLHALVNEGVLRYTDDARYVRARTPT